MQQNTVTAETITIKRAAQLIYAEGGFFSFYRGLASPLLSLVILNTMTFSTYASLKERFGVQSDTNVSGLEDSFRVALAAASVGPISACVSTPFELVKTQMQLNIKQASSLSSSAIGSRSSIMYAYQLVKQHGLRILYVGHGINVAREMLFLSTYFTAYENTKSFFKSVMHPTIAVPFAGGISGAAGWFISFPLDCVKSNIQGTQYSLPTDRPPKALTVAKNLLQTRGIFGLYSGLAPSIARAFLVSSSRFSAYESTMYVLR
jgi:solute carrier family 25 carnitine/acylcarnitine transporter 20/29